MGVIIALYKTVETATVPVSGGGEGRDAGAFAGKGGKDASTLVSQGAAQRS